MVAEEPSIAHVDTAVRGANGLQAFAGFGEVTVAVAIDPPAAHIRFFDGLHEEELVLCLEMLLHGRERRRQRRIQVCLPPKS